MQTILCSVLLAVSGYELSENIGILVGTASGVFSDLVSTNQIIFII